MTNKTIIKNYQLDFGDLGIQFKFNKDIDESQIKTIMHYFEDNIFGLNADFKLSNILYNNAIKDKEEIKY